MEDSRQMKLLGCSTSGRFMRFLTLLICMLLCASGCNSSGSDPLSQPGQTWTKGRGAGHSVRLLDSGRYAAYAWCDVCPREFTFGEWSEADGKIVLRPNDGASPAVLLPTKYRGCDGMVISSPDAQTQLLPNDVYFREGDSCSDSL